MAVNGYELDWDSEIDSDEQQHIILDEGDYAFIVDHTEKGNVGDTSENYAGMKQMTVFLNIIVPGQEEVQIRENFILHSNFTWKIGSLLVSTGLKEKGKPAQGGYWNKLPGTRGRCRIVQNKGKNGKIYNNVQTFLEPTAESSANKWQV